MAGTVLKRLVGIYNSNSGLLGDLYYVAIKIMGIDDCALCSITHGGIREKPEWQSARQGWDVPVEVIYRNQATPPMVEAAGGTFPCVLAETSAGFVLLLGRSDLASCGGEVEQLQETLRAALLERGLG